MGFSTKIRFFIGNVMPYHLKCRLLWARPTYHLINAIVQRLIGIFNLDIKRCITHAEVANYRRIVMLTAEQRQEIINDYKTSENDTGSADVQIALLTARITYLTEHFKTHKKDLHSRRGLLKLVNQRRKLQKYLKNKDQERYQKLINRLGLRR